MITIRKKNYIPYQDIEHPSHKVIFYPDLFADDIASKVIKNSHDLSIVDTATKLAFGLSELTGVKFRLRKNSPKPVGAVACIIFGKHDIVLLNKSGRRVTIKGEVGTVVIFGSIFREEWGYTVPRESILLYEYNPLPYIYTSITQRIKYAKEVKKELKSLEDLPEWKQCVQQYLPLDDSLGSGCYGNVFRSALGTKSFAVKLAKLKKDTLNAKPYSRDYSSWYEVHILKEIIKPIIMNGICPNLPLLIDTFACDKCSLTLRNKSIHTPCVITVVELANGSLKDFFKSKPAPEEYYSALFQIMTGLHAIQKYGQVMNYDVKAENILYYTVETGGYWKYVIMGKKFYVPNYGKLFIINDFGISRPMSPELPLYRTPQDTTFRLGSRYAIIKNGKFIPFNTDNTVERDGKIVDSPLISWDGVNKTRGGQYSMERNSGNVIPLKTKLHKSMISYLDKKGIDQQLEFFLDSDVIPPFEFINDVQDVIRTFIGGKRTTQSGNHHKYKIPNPLVKALSKYDTKTSLKDNKFSRDPAEVVAGYFITSFFVENTKYEKKPKGKKLATYVVS